MTAALSCSRKVLSLTGCPRPFRTGVIDRIGLKQDAELFIMMRQRAAFAFPAS
jgi:uncharacterized metal-binding protein